MKMISRKFVLAPDYQFYQCFGQSLVYGLNKCVCNVNVITICSHTSNFLHFSNDTFALAPVWVLLVWILELSRFLYLENFSRTESSNRNFNSKITFFCSD